VRFDVYHRFNEPGRRLKAGEFVIPSSLPEAEIGTFLDDIFHELAKPGQTVRREE